MVNGIKILDQIWNAWIPCLCGRSSEYSGMRSMQLFQQWIFAAVSLCWLDRPHWLGWVNRGYNSECRLEGRNGQGACPTFRDSKQIALSTWTQWWFFFYPFPTGAPGISFSEEFLVYFSALRHSDFQKKLNSDVRRDGSFEVRLAAQTPCACSAANRDVYIYELTRPRLHTMPKRRCYWIYLEWCRPPCYARRNEAVNISTLWAVIFHLLTLRLSIPCFLIKLLPSQSISFDQGTSDAAFAINNICYFSGLPHLLFLHTHFFLNYSVYK